MYRSTDHGQQYRAQEVRAFVVYNKCVTLGAARFKQLQGGRGNASPFLANLALMHRERIFVTEIPASRLYNIMSFAIWMISALSTIQVLLNSMHTHLSIQYITGMVLQPNVLQPTNGVLTHTQFLDLDFWVTVDPRIVYISLFDKRLVFGFNIHNFPDILSNMYKPQTISTCYTELVRMYCVDTHPCYESGVRWGGDSCRKGLTADSNN